MMHDKHQLTFSYIQVSPPYDDNTPSIQYSNSDSELENSNQNTNSTGNHHHPCRECGKSFATTSGFKTTYAYTFLNKTISM